MTKGKTKHFHHLSWENIVEWAGNRIAARGLSYQRQNRVHKLALLKNGGLLAWVDGTNQYITHVILDENGLPQSECTCPYGIDCKHGVAVVLEYLEQIKQNRPIPKVDKKDKRLSILKNKGRNIEDEVSDNKNELTPQQKERANIKAFLKDKTKKQLTELILDLSEKFPNLAQELVDRKELATGDVKSLVNRLKNDILQISSEPGWRNYWENEGYIPDYSQIRIKLKSLLKSGHPDEVLSLGEELIDQGNQQISMTDDDGETAMEIEACMPIVLKALDRSSLEKTDKLAWAVNAVLKDEYGVCDVFGDYLYQKHPKSAWNTLANRLLQQLEEMNEQQEDDGLYLDYHRDQLSNWILHALDNAGREEEVLPLCEAEARKTGRYSRLVNLLISQKQFTEAERWIREGISETQKQYPGIALNLRDCLKRIRTLQKDWIAVATLQTEEFIGSLSETQYVECQKACTKAKKWPEVREHLLIYLEKGKLPWEQKGWPLGQPTLVENRSLHKKNFPMISILIQIAILEKKPDQVLYWLDRNKEKGHGLEYINEGAVANAIQKYAPMRAVAIWRKMAETLIAHTNPNAYAEAVVYLDKAKKVMKDENKLEEWNGYIESLREKNKRKRRFIEILSQSQNIPMTRKSK
jgi:uncharacterized Zn finger protein